MPIPPPHRILQHYRDFRSYFQKNRAPWRTTESGIQYLLCKKKDAARDDIIVSNSQFTSLLLDRFKNELRYDTTLALVENRPEASAKNLLRMLKFPGTLLLAFVAMFALFAPNTFFIFFNLIVVATILSMTAIRTSLAVISAKLLPAPIEIMPIIEDLPIITVLVPVFREKEILPALASQIQKIDYPKNLLDLKLLLEEEDAETLDEALRIGMDETFDIVIVPNSQPQTKPKACNYGLRCARGDLIVIYDAEDAPDVCQLKKAVSAFSKGDTKLACVQAKLNFYNPCETWLTRLFALDYSLWFDHMLPALDKISAPIPLGGTSNIFRTAVLMEAGGWDPYNVTEDADLGFRLARLGYKTDVIASTTFEEANCKTANWIRQRSRWIKGYIQTWAVHRVRGNALLDWRSIISIDGFIGATAFAAIANPILIIFSILAVAGPTDISKLSPTWLDYLNLIVLTGCNLVLIALNYFAPRRRGRALLSSSAFLTPIYWLMISWAAYRALWQLIVRPSFWEKTEHGISLAAKERRAEALRALGLE
ncbi:MAG: glycosyltransferase [Parvularculaceae bacterium]